MRTANAPRRGPTALCIAGLRPSANSRSSSNPRLRRGTAIRKHSKSLGAFRSSLASLLGIVVAAHAQEGRDTAIDILLEPDATMAQHAQADNARLLKAYPAGFALDPTHQPHLTLIQQFAHTADLEKVYAAANQVLAKTLPSSTIATRTLSWNSFVRSRRV